MELANPTYFILLLILPLFYWLLPFRFRSLCLLIGSYLFYAWWDLRYVPILVASTILDFYLGRWIGNSEQARRRKQLLFLSLAANLGLLAFFKYANFFFSLVDWIRPAISASSEPFQIFVPLGISFYTFHSISYVVDIYRRKIEPINSYIAYSVYVTFFPKLISGPIERAETFVPQLAGERSFSLQLFREAIGLLAFGYFIKLCLADRMGDLTGIIFEDPLSYTLIDRWISLYAFSIQIYADFFGYTKIAQGSALLFGLRLSNNFESPYLAESVQEFWRRWHTTLSSWFRDYLYIPLGGGKVFPLRNIMLTMVLAGLWHGASFNFVFWGFYHGLLLILGRMSFWPSFSRWINVFFTFHLVSFGWILFQADSLSEAKAFFFSLWNLSYTINSIVSIPTYFFIFAGLGTTVLFLEKIHLAGIRERKLSVNLLATLFTGLLILLTLFLGAGNANPFVYFQF